MEKYVQNLRNKLKKAVFELHVLFVPSYRNNYMPMFLHSRILLYAAVFLLMVEIVTVGFYLPLNNDVFFADITKTDLVNLLNQTRQNAGLTVLAENNKLDQAAMLKAQDMVSKDYFAHQSPQGLTPWYWFSQAGYSYKYAGENLAVGFFDSKEVFNAWYNSPGHKANLLNPNYKEVGTAVLPGFGGGNSIIVVQEFGSAKQTVTPALARPATPKTVAPAPKPIPKVTQVAVKPPVTTQITDNQNQTKAAEPDSSPKNTTPEVLGLDSAGQISQAIPQSTTVGSSLYSNFVNFMIYDYQKLIMYVSYLLLLAVIISLFINVWKNLNVQRVQLILKSLLIIGILSSVVFLNQYGVSHIAIHQIFI